MILILKIWDLDLLLSSSILILEEGFQIQEVPGVYPLGRGLITVSLHGS